jgi:2-polyprenyl-3-methyl-5-hydroxy-6-metoxy-1,4-benzoquinol methylase
MDAPSNREIRTFRRLLPSLPREEGKLALIIGDENLAAIAVENLIQLGGTMSGQDYVNYIHWKSWPNDSFFRFSLHEANYFSADFDDVSLLDAKFLEIGFGNGSLLSWAKSRGAAIYGIETLETSLERAKEKNIPLLSSDLGDNLPQFNEFFDVIAAYDVLEHLSIPEIIITLDAIAKMLKPGGELMLRFPNRALSADFFSMRTTRTDPRYLWQFLTS